MLRAAFQRASKKERSEGQTLVLFALSSVLIIGMVAVVIDVAWFWTNEQAMQKAADAGALAGAVYLPGNVSGAYTAALAEAKKNGYINGQNGVTVTPQQDAQNRRQLNVTIRGPVQAYFAQVFCAIASCTHSINETVTAKAEFTLPVPMGSPQNYYGVGTYVYNQINTTTTTNNGNTGWKDATANPSGAWTSTSNAYTWNNSSYATTTSTTTQLQLGTFGLSVPSGAAIDGIQVRLGGKISTSSSNCTFKVELSYNGGSSWVPSGGVSTASLTTTNTILATLGSSSSTSTWSGHSWVYGDFSNSNLRMRVTYVKGAGCSATTVSLDGAEVQVNYHTTTTTTTTTQTTGSVTSPTGGSLTSQGFWGAVIAKGGSRENGDQFSPYNDNSSISGHTSTNPDYTDQGYDYTVILPGGSGQVKLYDATFCETGSNGSGGNMGAGDHWIGGSPNGVTTVYQLWNENNTPYDTSDDTLVATSGSTFANEIQADYSGVMGTPAHSGLTDCSTNPYHNAWYTLATGLSAGRYRVNVNTSSSNNNSTNAENMFSLWVTSTGTPQVYGEGKMAAYNNLVAGNQLFYLAQIGAENAGKTMEISLFDPGDVSGNAYLRIESPDGNSYNYATFSWSADNGTSGTNVTQIQTASSGGSFFNDRLITIDVALPSTYGSVGLTPPGETQAGWWKIEYQVSGGNDTTTWQVGIRGSPVHLIVP